MKKVLIIGSGGREHALGWNIAKSEEVSEVLYTPGNGGTEEGKGRNVSIDGSKDNFQAISELIKAENIDLTVVGPEAPLASGLVDFLNLEGYNRVFGPTKYASLLESDKYFSFDLMEQLGIPQAQSIKCYSTKEAKEAIEKMATEHGVVIKARGLTGGKGVTVCDSVDFALKEINDHAESYGPEVLIAQRLFGQEFSVFGISDGNKVLPLELSLQDHKPLLDGDKGPNTGGMGAYGPAPIAPVKVVRYVADEIMTPIVQKMKTNGNEYKGFLYAGMIMTEQGPKVIEFNIRFGDPECQPAMMMVKESLYKPLSLALEGRLDEIDIQFNEGASCCVVLAAKGYPGSYKKSLPISGIDDANSLRGIKVFHAGTTKNGQDMVTAGGRVLGVTGYSPDGISDARKLAYEAVSKITIPEGFVYRNDIANKAFEVTK